jgi:glutamine amidotransferase PdxT
MAGKVDNKPSGGLALLDFHALRNSYGRQLSSGSRLVIAPGFLEKAGEEMPFIRAPRFELSVSAKSGAARAAAWLEDGSPAAVMGGWRDHLLATAFHPELTGSRGFHRWIVGKALSINLQQ